VVLAHLATGSLPGLFVSSIGAPATVANIKSQIKRNRQNENRRERNKATRSELKSRIKTAQRAIATGSDDATDLTVVAQKRLDKAAGKGRIHRNQAARRTSRLMKRAAARADK
jgi:small subunit ribosomal protein S20